MKKLFTVLFCVMLGISAIAQQKIQLRSADRAECTKSDMTSLKASFSFSTIEAEEVATKGGDYSWISMPNTVLGGNEGDPQIPVVNQLIAVPVGAEPTITVTSYSTKEYNLTEMGVKTLIPRQPSLRKNQNPEDVPFVMNQAAYQTRGMRTEPQAVVEVVGTMRGVRLGKMTIEPVSYDPVNNTLRVFNDIEVEVSFNGADAKATEDMLIDTYSPYFDIVYKQLFNNRAVMDAYTDHPDLYKTPVKMLVVATSTYTSTTAFQNWLNWKRQKGIDVDIYTVTSSTASSTIRSEIQNRYNTNHPTFLVIVGDETVVKAYKTDWSCDSYYGNCINDMEYASVDNDVYHDMYMSRMSVSSTTELGNLINKILTYEQYTMSDPSYLNNSLLVAGWDDYWTNQVGKPTIQYANNNYYNSAHGITPTVYITTASGQTAAWNNINNVGFINYTAHGDIQELSDPVFSNTNASNLTNNGKYFWLVANCCLSANWGNNTYKPCLGETLIRAANKGAFGYIGSIPETLWYEDYYFGVGAFNFKTGGAVQTVSGTSVGMYDAAFDETGFNCLNAMPYIGNVAVTYAHAKGYSSSVDDEYYWRAYQTLGDGSVMPYLKVPAANNVSHNSTIPAGSSTFRVNADAGSYVSITVNNNIIGVAAVPANATYVDVPFTTTPVAGTTAMIVVTRNQRQPYINTNVPVVGVGEQYEITATVNPAGAGSVEGAGQYYENTNCTLTAIPNSGYGFTNWSNGSTDNPLTVTVTGNANYTANFHALEQHHITYTPQQSHGMIGVSPVNAYAGDIVTLTATPDAGFVLDQWDVNTVSKGNVPVENNQFVMPDKAVTVSATFRVADPLTVAGEGGTTSNSHIPFEGLYADDNYQHTQTIYPSSMLTDMQGMQITKLTYYLKTAITTNLTSIFEVRLGTTMLSEFSSGTVNYLSMTGTANYTGTIDVTNSSQEVEITLATPYTYTSGNLIIDVRLTDHKTGYKTTDFLGETGSTYYSVYSKSSSNQPPFTQGTAAPFMPKTTFTYEVPQPYISLNPSSATVFTGFTETLTATYGNVSGTPTITYTSSNTSVATVTGNGTTATVTGVSAGTATITATMTFNSNTYTSTCTVTVEDPSYCTPSFGSNDDCITNITLGDINNTTASSSTNGYGNYTSLTTDLEPGETYTLSLTSGSGSGDHYAAVWIDFDNSYSFETSERVGTSGTIGASATANITLTIPNDASVGSHRMRVVYQYNVTATSIDPCASATYGEAEDYTVVISSPSCPKPTGLALSGITAHGVTATWDAETGDVFQYAMVLGANVNPSTVTTYDGSITATGTTCSMGWNTLSPDTDYTVVIRKDCGSGEYSVAVAQSFTTLETCPKPTNVTASNLTINSAHISWNGDAESYNVKYATATVTGTTLDPVFEDGFESGINSWTTYAVGNYTSDGTDWHQYDATNFSSGDVTNHNGSYVAMSRSYSGSQDVSVDNWLVTPQMTLGDVVKFYVCGDDAGWQEYYAVYVSTETNAVSDFTMVIAPELAPGDGSWAERTIDLSAYAGQQGYIAIRHTDEGKDFLLIDDFGVYNTVNAYTYGTFTTLPPTTETSCDINGLSPETFYVAQVQSDCGSADGTSGWSSVYFTTPDACSAPTDLVTSSITANTAILGWADNQDRYNVRYRKVYFFEGFEDENLPAGWTTIDVNEDGNTWSVGHATTHTGNNGAANISYIYNTSGTTPDDYLVSPLLDLQGTLRVWLSGFGTSNAEHFEILLSTTGNTASDFTTTLVAEAETTNEYVEYTADLSSYAGHQGYIAIHHFNCIDQRYLYVDDFGLYGSENWTTETTNDATLALTSLSMGTTYEWQVQGVDCNTVGDNTEWSAVATFSTYSAMFDNEIWNGGTGYTDDVLVIHDVIIPSGGTAIANSITLAPGAHLIIKDGGQLYHNEDVTATLEKDIVAYTSKDSDGWYLISTPVDDINVSDVFSGTYDLYMYDEPTAYWWSHSGTLHPFTKLNMDNGYLYASDTDQTLEFTGDMMGTEVKDISLDLDYTATQSDAVRGFNLMGNPLTRNLRAGDMKIGGVELSTYMAAENGTALTTHNISEDPIKPGRGFFVQATEAGQHLVFNPSSAKGETNNGYIKIVVANENSFDNAFINIANGNTLRKMNIANTMEVYVINEDEDYAAARVEELEGKIPVNFKAVADGEYTITINANNVEARSMYLRDNFSGETIDLLESPTYTFKATANDDEARFTLLFDFNNFTGIDENLTGEIFAYQYGDEIIVNGEGTLEVFDVMGRMVLNTKVNGVQKVNVPANAVYIFRMVGETIQTQKIVVR